MLSTAKQEHFNSYQLQVIVFEEGRENFVGLSESFPMKTHLDMGNNPIYNVKTPSNNDQGANKGYVDTQVTTSSSNAQNAVNQV